MKYIKFIKVSIVTGLISLAAGCGTNHEGASELASGDSSTCPSNIAWRSTNIGLNINATIRDYAASHLGKQVGDGECAALPHAALRSIGAKSFDRFGPTGPKADYVWGGLSKTLTTSNRDASGVLPGDIIQYQNFSQTVRTPTGSWSSNAAHHSAIVKAVSVDGRSICVYQQNSGGRRFVTTGYINLNGMTGGTLRVYNPRLM